MGERAAGPLAVVTHCHTRQSRGAASPLDDLIRRAVERVTGAPADGFEWAESLTTPEQIERLLRPRRGRSSRRGVDLVFVTDHVNETFRELDADLVDLASAEPRIAIGAEVQTVAEAPAGSGRYRDAPEVLLYGGPDRVRGRGGWHYGVNAEILRDLQRRCRPAGSRRVELHRVLAYCRARGFAHAISHPLDGHGLDLRSTLEALAANKFLEVVNGGYGDHSAARLRRYIRLHNAIVEGGAPARAAVASADARWLLAHLGRSRRPDRVSPGIVPWAGSDAHLGRYDRVCVLYRPRTNRAGVADLLRDMVRTPARELRAERVFESEGRGNGLGLVSLEVLRLVVANARATRSSFRGPRRLLRLAAIAPRVALGEILRGRREAWRLGRELDAVLAQAAAAIEVPVRASLSAATAS